MKTSSESIWLVWIFRGLWFIYSLLLGVHGYVHSQPLGKTVLWITLSMGGWIGVYLWISKKEISYFNMTLHHGRNPVFRLVAVLMFLVVLYTIPFGLRG